MKKHALTFAATLIFGFAAIQAGVYPVFAIEIAAFALFATAFNLLLGYTGLLSFGHAAFFGIGAYACGFALQSWGWSTPTGVAFAVSCAALGGLIFGALAIQRSGIYFAMITLALAQMLYFFLLEAPFTHGEDGLQGIPRGDFFGFSLSEDTHLFAVILILFATVFFLVRRITESPFGQLMFAIRDNENRAISLGYHTRHAKLLAFVLSAALAGLGGAVKALALGFASLPDAHWSTSGLVILMVLIGGLGTAWGPSLGALLIISLDNHLGDLGNALAHSTGLAWFGGLGESVGMVTGLIFMLSVLLFRNGVAGSAQPAWLAFKRTVRSALTTPLKRTP